MEENSPFMGPSYSVRIVLINEQAAGKVSESLRSPKDKNRVSDALLQRIGSSQSLTAAYLLRSIGMENCRFSVSWEFSCIDEIESNNDGYYVDLTLEPNFFCSSEDFDAFADLLESPTFNSAGNKAIKRELLSFLASTDDRSLIREIRVEMTSFGYG